MSIISHQLEALKDRKTRDALGSMIAATLCDLSNLINRLQCQTMTSAALRIHGGSASPKAQTNASAYVSTFVPAGTFTEYLENISINNGGAGAGTIAMFNIATTTDLPALSGVVVNGTFNIFAFFISNAGVASTVMGTAGATLAAVVPPVIPQNSAMLGFVIINPTGTGNFTGNTTNLDDGTVVPNAVFVNTVGAIDISSRLYLKP